MHPNSALIRGLRRLIDLIERKPDARWNSLRPAFDLFADTPEEFDALCALLGEGVRVDTEDFMIFRRTLSENVRLDVNLDQPTAFEPRLTKHVDTSLPLAIDRLISEAEIQSVLDFGKTAEQHLRG